MGIFVQQTRQRDSSELIIHFLFLYFKNKFKKMNNYTCGTHF